MEATPKPYNPHRLVYTDQTDLPYPNTKGEFNFDNKILLVLAALLCALICALGLNSIVRCGLRQLGFDQRQEQEAAAVSPKRGLSQIPVVSYKSAELSVTDCPICLGEFAQGEKVRVLPKCYHGFHVKCIDKWLMSHCSCPLCRQPLQLMIDTA